MPQDISRRLALTRETVRELSGARLGAVAGGVPPLTRATICYQLSLQVTCMGTCYCPPPPQTNFC